jgi:uncharacterized membrane protein (DUF373 family)
MRQREVLLLQTALGGAETLIYVSVAVLLLIAAGLAFAGTVVNVLDGIGSRSISSTGVLLLDQVLLLFIVAELLYTLRVVNFGGQIFAEPFLLIGMIAVVRKILVIAAETAGPTAATTDIVLQIAALGGLALVLAVAIYLLRRSASMAPAEGAEPRAP